MFSFIEKLQKRSDHEKRAIALGVAGCATLVITIVWIMSASFSYAPREEKKSNLGPFRAFTRQIGGEINSLIGTILDAKNMFRTKPETFVAE